MAQNGGKPCDRKLTKTQRCKELPPCPQDFSATAGHRNYRNQPLGRDHLFARTTSPPLAPIATTTTTTTSHSSSMMDDEDESKFLRLLEATYLANLSPPPPPPPPPSPSLNSPAGSRGLATDMELIGSGNFYIKNGFILSPNSSRLNEALADNNIARNSYRLNFDELDYYEKFEKGH